MVDGYEYQSALDLNSIALPYPGKRPWPNALDPSDGGYDFDGDGLTLSQEYSLWRYAGATFPVIAVQRRHPEQRRAHVRHARPRRPGSTATATASSPTMSATPTATGSRTWSSSTCRAPRTGGSRCTRPSRPTRSRSFSGLSATDPDTDGDGVLDGADDQDHDGWTNFQEMQLDPGADRLPRPALQPVPARTRGRATCSRYPPFIERLGAVRRLPARRRHDPLPRLSDGPAPPRPTRGTGSAGRRTKAQGRASSRTWRASARTPARSTACPVVTRSEALTRGSPPASAPAGAAPRAQHLRVAQHQSRRPRPAAARVGGGHDIHPRARDEPAARRERHDVEGPLAAAQRRCRRLDLREQRRIDVGARGDRHRRPAARDVLGAAIRGARRVAQRHAAHRQRARGRRACRRRTGARAATTPTTGASWRPQRPLATRHVRRGQHAEQQRQAEQHRGAAAARHSTARQAGSSIATRAPRADGAASRRPPWRSTMSAVIARPAPATPAPGARPARQLTHGRRQAGSLVGDLDADPVALAAPGELDAPRAVLERVRDEVADGLRQAHAVAAHDRPRPGRDDVELAAERRCDRAPRAALAGDEVTDVDGLVAVGRAQAPRRRGEVVERRAGAAQLEVDAAPRPGVQRRSWAAISGPRSSWQARATSSRRRRSSARRTARGPRRSRRGPRPRSTAVIPRPPTARGPARDPRRPGRRRAGSRRPTRSRRSGRRARRACGAGGRRASPACAWSRGAEAPDRAQQLVLREDARRLARERAQQRELLLRQGDAARRAAARCARAGRPRARRRAGARSARGGRRGAAAPAPGRAAPDSRTACVT